MQVQSSKQPMLRALYTFAMRDGEFSVRRRESIELIFPTGIKSLWSGLSASILRQTTYSTARFGLYNSLARKAKQLSGDKLSSTSTVACAGIAGGAAGMLGNPAEVVLVRMCADGVKPVTERYMYPNAVAGMIRIGQEEGLKAFYKGLGSNVIRSVLMSEFVLFRIAKMR
jgi:dicarboxylate transporter 10